MGLRCALCGLARGPQMGSPDGAQQFCKWGPRGALKKIHGRVKFNNGDRVGSINILQMQGGEMVKIAEYDASDSSLDFTKGKPIYWRGGRVPLDRTIQHEEMRHVSTPVYLALVALASTGIIMACCFLGLNIHFRTHRFIKMSSPNMNNVIIVGCVLCYLSIILLGTDGSFISTSPEFFRYWCRARAWVLALGFTLAFGGMFSKTWRVHAIFTNIKLNRKVIKDYKLILVVLVLVLIDVAILVGWQVVDPFQKAVKHLVPEVYGDYEVIPKLEFCSSQHMEIWMGSIYAYKGLLLAFGCFLAWETRHVSIPALNDSKYIGMSVYNVVIMCTCGAAVTFLIQDQPTHSFVIIAVFIIFATTATLCLVFVPKIIQLQRDPKGDDKRIRATLRKPSRNFSDEDSEHFQHKVRLTTEENRRLRGFLEQKAAEVDHLLEQLGEEPSRNDLSIKSALHKKVLELRSSDGSPSKLSRVSYQSDIEVLSTFSDVSMATMSTMYVSETSPGRQLKSRLLNNRMYMENIEMADIRGGGGGRGRKPSLTIPPPAEEEDDDPFGGVYIGPPDPPPAPRKTSDTFPPPRCNNTCTGDHQPTATTSIVTTVATLYLDSGGSSAQNTHMLPDCDHYSEDSVIHSLQGLQTRLGVASLRHARANRRHSAPGIWTIAEAEEELLAQREGMRRGVTARIRDKGENSACTVSEGMEGKLAGERAMPKIREKGENAANAASDGKGGNSDGVCGAEVRAMNKENGDRSMVNKCVPDADVAHSFKTKLVGYDPIKGDGETPVREPCTHGEGQMEEAHHKLVKTETNTHRNGNSFGAKDEQDQEGILNTASRTNGDQILLGTAADIQSEVLLYVTDQITQAEVSLAEPHDGSTQKKLRTSFLASSVPSHHRQNELDGKHTQFKNTEDDHDIRPVHVCCVMSPDLSEDDGHCSHTNNAQKIDEVSIEGEFVLTDTGSMPELPQIEPEYQSLLEPITEHEGHLLVLEDYQCMSVDKEADSCNVQTTVSMLASCDIQNADRLSEKVPIEHPDRKLENRNTKQLETLYGQLSQTVIAATVDTGAQSADTDWSRPEGEVMPNTHDHLAVVQPITLQHAIGEPRMSSLQILDQAVPTQHVLEQPVTMPRELDEPIQSQDEEQTSLVQDEFQPVTAQQELDVPVVLQHEGQSSQKEDDLSIPESDEGGSSQEILLIDAPFPFQNNPPLPQPNTEILTSAPQPNTLILTSVPGSACVMTQTTPSSRVFHRQLSLPTPHLHPIHASDMVQTSLSKTAADAWNNQYGCSTRSPLSQTESPTETRLSQTKRNLPSQSLADFEQRPVHPHTTHTIQCVSDTTTRRASFPKLKPVRRCPPSSRSLDSPCREHQDRSKGAPVLEDKSASAPALEDRSNRTASSDDMSKSAVVSLDKSHSAGVSEDTSKCACVPDDRSKSTGAPSSGGSAQVFPESVVTSLGEADGGSKSQEELWGSPTRLTSPARKSAPRVTFVCDVVEKF